MIHKHLIESTGGSEGIRDEELLDSALSNPFQSINEEELYPSIQAKAAQLCFGLVRNHPMLDGDKRLGAHVMLVIELRYTIKKKGIMVFCFYKHHTRENEKEINITIINYNIGSQFISL